MIRRLDAHGPPIALGNDEVAHTLARVPLATRTADGDVTEDFLKAPLFEHPEALPIAVINASYAGAIPVCRELSTPAGFLARYVNALGYLTLVKFKL